MCPEAETESQAKIDPAVELFKFRREMGTITRQSGVFFAGTMFTAAASYLFKFFVARWLGAELLGVYALGMTVVGFLGVFAAVGLPSAAVRFVAVYNSNGKVDLLRGFLGRSILFVLLVSSLLAGIAVLGSHWIAGPLYHTPALVRYMPWFGLMIVTAGLGSFLGQVLAGFKDVTRRTMITNFISSPLMMVLAILLLAAGVGLRGYIAAQVLSSAVALFLLAAVAWRLTPAAARSPLTNLPRLEPEVIHFSAVVFGMGILEFFLGQTDKILLGHFLDARQVGIYAIAAALVTFVPIALQTVNQIFSPVIADLHARGERVLIGRLYQTLTKWILGFTIPLALVMILYAPVFMRLFGRDFEPGWPVLVIGTFGQLVNCGVGSTGYLLLMSGNQRRLLKIQVAMAAATILFNLTLIPLAGLIGAALVGTVVNGVTNLWSLIEVRRALGLSPYNRGFLALLLPSAITAALLVALRYSGEGRLPGVALLLAALSIAYAVFAGVALLFGLDADDRLIVKAVWARVQATVGRV